MLAALETRYQMRPLAGTKNTYIRRALIVHFNIDE